MSISIGILGEEAINYHRAFECGNSSMSCIVGKNFKEVKFTVEVLSGTVVQKSWQARRVSDYSEAFSRRLVVEFHSLLAGIHGTKPCGDSSMQAFSTGDTWRHHRHSIAGLRTLASGTKTGMNSLSGQFFSEQVATRPLTPKERVQSLRVKRPPCARITQKNCSFDLCKQFKLPVIIQPKLKMFKDSA
ncbi:hypothetical protein AVEN_113460-1 [Araneus ventricosus]|uniref:Uncharacterized protein n=1 Tax=Araneus ventricosus TaxID=182803 RepID=A0A4Y2MYU6_ARAVE|nr:hypothetical protein AVEN_113460-1 [Araneus ventricosus]